MKKILTYMSVVVLAAGCAEMYGPEQESTPVVKSDGIEIALVSDDKADTDSTVTFKLTPKGEALYYSYAIEASAQDSKPDSSVVYSGALQTAVADSVIKWTAEKPSATITVKGLMPNTQYQIYAVAGSPTGVPSSVSVQPFKTTDNVAPAIKSDYDANVLTISFPEAVTRNKDLPLTVKYYGVNTTNIDTGIPEGEFQIPEDSIKVSGSGNSWTISIPVAAEEDDEEEDEVTPPAEGSAAEGPVLPEGAIYTVDLPEGAFKDNAGNATEAVTSTVKYVDGQGIVPSGIFGQNDASTYEFTEPEAASFSDWEQPVVVASSGKFALSLDYPFSNTAAATVVYKTGSKSITYTLTKGTDFEVLDDQNIAFYLPEEPELGADVTISLAAGSVQDIYGNVNTAWTATMKYSYGYTMKDVYGTYSYSCINGLTGQQNSGQMVITESDDPKYGNVMFTSFMGYDETFLYGTFDPVAGTLSVETLQGFAIEGDVMIGFGSLILSGNNVSLDGENPTVFNMPEAGRIVFNNGYFGLFTATLQGQIQGLTGAFTMFEAVKENTVSAKYTQKSSAAEMRVVTGNIDTHLFVR